MRLPDWCKQWFWRAPKSKHVGDFKPGMSLAPGESVDLQIVIPPKYHELMLAARARGKKVGFNLRSSKRIGPNLYRTEVELIAGKEVLAVLRIEYSA